MTNMRLQSILSIAYYSKIIFTMLSQTNCIFFKFVYEDIYYRQQEDIDPDEMTLVFFFKVCLQVRLLLLTHLSFSKILCLSSHIAINSSSCTETMWEIVDIMIFGGCFFCDALHRLMLDVVFLSLTNTFYSVTI